MKRSEMATFIRKIADGTFEQAEWSEVMINHYQDISTESARAKAIKIYDDHAGVPDDKKKQYLRNLAHNLDQPFGELDFYFHGEAAGILNELPTVQGEMEVEYEPYRSGSHFDMQAAIDNGGEPICEFMRDGIRAAFVVLSCPSYGRLKIKLTI